MTDICFLCGLDCGSLKHKSFHKTEKDFKDQQRRDKLKIKLCKLNKIKLITIPYKYNCYDPNKMYEFIDNQIK
jgi:hypothetical protein